ncbi:MAG: sialidase family protein [Edaphobacter sp.]
MISLRFSFVLLLSLLVGRMYAEPAGELIFAPGSAPFASSHASSLVELKDGELMSAWFGGTAEGKPDVAIWSSRKTSAGWSAPVELVREPDVPCWNPVLFHTQDGRLWLYYKFGPSPSTWVAGRMYSDDEGKSWSAVEHLPAGLLGPIRAKPLVLKDGTVVSGTSVEAYHTWAVWIERSTDNGKTWATIGPIMPTAASEAKQPAEVNSQASSQLAGTSRRGQTNGIIQPSVVSLGGRHLRLYARSTSSIARVCVADSYDNGVTWTQARALDIPNPNSGIDAVALRDGRVVLIYNNTATGRTPLNLAVSCDGEHFRMFRTLEDQPGEYSYPAIIQTSSGDLEMTYTWNRTSIRHVHLPLSDVPKQ